MYDVLWVLLKQFTDTVSWWCITQLLTHSCMLYSSTHDTSCPWGIIHNARHKSRVFNQITHSKQVTFPLTQWPHPQQETNRFRPVQGPWSLGWKVPGRREWVAVAQIHRSQGPRPTGQDSSGHPVHLAPLPSPTWVGIYKGTHILHCWRNPRLASAQKGCVKWGIHVGMRDDGEMNAEVE